MITSLNISPFLDVRTQFDDMKKLLYCFILLSQSGEILGQNVSTIDAPSQPAHSLSLSVGVSRTSLKFETVSSNIFKGTAAPLQLTYRRNSGVSRQSIELSYQSQTLKTSFGFKIVELGGHLSYGYLRKVKNFDKMNVFVGGSVRFSGANRKMPQGSNSESTVISSALNVSSLAEYAIGKHRFEGQLSLAVLGYNLRPYNNLNRNSEETFWDNFSMNARLETIPQYFDVFWRLGYFVPTTSRHFQWRFDYLSNYCGFQQRQYLGTLTHQLTTSFTYQF